MRTSRLAAAQVLRVGIGGDELHAPQARLDHAVDGVAPGAAHADDLDDRAGVLEILGDLDLQTRSSKIELTCRIHAGFLRGVRRVTPVPQREDVGEGHQPHGRGVDRAEPLLVAGHLLGMRHADARLQAQDFLRGGGHALHQAAAPGQDQPARG